MNAPKLATLLFSIGWLQVPLTHLSAADWIGAGPEIVVNQSTDGHQWRSAPARLSGGRYVIAWQAEHNGNFGDDEVVYRVYEANGTPVTDERIAAATSARPQGEPSVAALHNGGFVIVWSAINFAHATSDDDVVGQYFDANGDKVGAEFLVNATIEGSQGEPGRNLVVPFVDGGFIVVFETAFGAPNYRDLFARIFDLNGNTPYGDIPIAQVTAADQRRVDGVALTDGRILLVWDTAAADIPSHNEYAIEVKGRLFAGNGPQGDEFLVNTTRAKSQWGPAASALPNGGAVVAWISNDQDGDDDGIFLQRYAGTGGNLLAKVGGEIQANTYTTDLQRNPDVTSFPDGSFFVSWQSEYFHPNLPDSSEDGDFAGIFGQAFLADGTPEGGQVSINLTTVSFQENVRLLAISPDRVRAIWESSDQDGEFYGIYTRDVVRQIVSPPISTTVTANHSLNASGPAVATWRMRRGGAAAGKRVFGLRNVGEDAAAYRTTGLGGWLKAKGAVGSLLPGATRRAEFFIENRSAKRLVPRTYQKTVRIINRTNPAIVKTFRARLIVR